MKQLDVYTEEKFEDEEDMRERIRSSVMRGQKGHERAGSDSDAVLQDLVLLAKQHGDLYPTMLDILRHYSDLLQREVGM